MQTTIFRYFFRWKDYIESIDMSTDGKVGSLCRLRQIFLPKSFSCIYKSKYMEGERDRWKHRVTYVI